ncbi:hypothetical protein QUF63_10645 [Anaerolineales bacterium HSG25]|nr:hypothetical protein [Anaerolineales bacterium HSG25]
MKSRYLSIFALIATLSLMLFLLNRAEHVNAEPTPPDLPMIDYAKIVKTMNESPLMFVQEEPNRYRVRAEPKPPLSQPQTESNRPALQTDEFTAIEAGGSHTCGLTAQGGVKCWGYNNYGQVGDGTTTSRPTPVDVTGLSSGVTAIATGNSHTCALTNQGGVKCWGYNNYGQVGNGTTSYRVTRPIDVIGLSNGIIAIATGGSHTCVLTNQGGVKCWGNNDGGQLGDGTNTDRGSPVDVNGLTSGVTAITVGTNHTCALTNQGGVKCWGYYNWWRTDWKFRTAIPIDIDGLSNGIIAISSGYDYTCVLTNQGGVKCWGYNNYGQVGDGTTYYRTSPVDVIGLNSGITAITSSSYHTCALTVQGGIKCWGNNSSGQLGDETTTNQTTPVNVTGLNSGIAAISAGGTHTCALTVTGTVKCWGYNNSGQLGDGQPDIEITKMSELNNTPTILVTSDFHSCVLTDQGGVKCWGRNGHGQLGDGTTTNRITPVDVSGLNQGVTSVAVGSSHSCALTSSGVKCWGNNSSGQLGNGTTNSYTTPVTSLNSGSIAIAVGDLHSCALTSSGGIKCWGDNSSGQLGDGTTTNHITAVDVIGLSSGVVAITAGDSHSCALANNGGVKCWGYNGFGRLGDGTTTVRTTPVEVIGLSSGVIAITANGSHTCALTSIGSLKCWGRNYWGQLGDGTVIDRSTPIEVTGLNNGVASVTTGGSHSCALMSQGNVKCWGRNFGGKNTATPVDVSDLDNVTVIAAGNHHTCALTNQNKVKCWGFNDYGQLGNNTTSDRTTPSEVTGLGNKIKAITHNCALTDQGGVTCTNELKSGITTITTGGHHCALTTQGRVKCWGNNQYGQLGDGTTTSRTTPVDVVALNDNVTTISAGGYHSCTLTDQNEVKCWGLNNYGQLGGGIITDVMTTSVTVVNLTDVISITTGTSHSCALTNQGGVKCWGKNEHGQIGNNTTTDRTTPNSVSGLSRGVTAIAAGDSHTCALTTQGGVKCWGYNNYGQLGDGSTTDRTSPVDVNGFSGPIIAITAGDSHTCALTDQSRVKCWGKNFSYIPTDVKGLSDGIVAIAAGNNVTQFLFDDGTVASWSSTNSSYNPTPVDIGYPSLQVSTKNILLEVPDNLSQSFTVKNNGLVHTTLTWEASSNVSWLVIDNWYPDTVRLTAQVDQLDTGVHTGQITVKSNGGNAAIKVTLIVPPIKVTGLNKLSAGVSHTCANTSQGGIKCWGRNYLGQLGNGTQTDSSIPVQVSGLDNKANMVTAGGNHTCTLLKNGQIQCWGYNYDGQLGDDSRTSRPLPVSVSGLENRQGLVVETGSAHTCALLDNGQVRCWGNNGSGRLGDGTTTRSTVPVTVTGLLSNIIDITVGSNHTCALNNEGSVHCWGYNQSGRLGDGTTTSRPTPVEVQGLSSKVTDIVAGGNHTCTRTNENMLYCWGENGSGQLGYGNTVDQTTPVTVTGLAGDVKTLVAGGNHTCVLLESGQVQCWGDNAYGQLGDGSYNDKTRPITVTGLTTPVNTITTGYDHTCAVTTDETTLCWGRNDYGQLGNDSSTRSAVPVELGYAILDVDATQFEFATPTITQSFNINNKGSAELSWEISTNVSWLTHNKTSGTGNKTIQVSINTTNLQQGLYQGQLTISSNGGNHNIDVVLFVPNNFTDSLPSISPVELVNSLQEIATVVDIQDNLAYISIKGNLLVVDISTPTSPNIIGKTPPLTNNYAQDILVKGNYAYLTTGSTGLFVVDISTPTNPTLAGQTNAPAFKIEAVGNYAYLTDNSSLHVVDITTPTQPISKTIYEANYYIHHVNHSNGYLYLATGFAGVQILDISNPLNPNLVATYNTPSYALTVQVLGNNLYVADYNGGLQIVDISVPAQPTFAGTYNLPNGAYQVNILDNYAYILNGNNQLVMANINNPTQPIYAGVYNVTDTIYDFKVANPYVYLAGGRDGFLVLDISNPDIPLQTGNSKVLKAYHISGIDNYGYIANGNSGVRVMDLDTLTEIANYETTAKIYQTHFDNNNLYLAGGSAGLIVLNATTPTSLTFLAQYQSLNQVYAVSTSGNYVYIANGNHGFEILDFTSSTTPTHIGKLDTFGTAYEVIVDGSYAYVADGEAGVQIININNPISPTITGHTDISGTTRAIALKTPYLYVATGDYGLQILDITNPASPSIIGKYDTSGYAYDIQFVDRYAYIADGENGLQIIDIHNPTTPMLVGSYNTTGSSQNVYLTNNNIYIADSQRGILKLGYNVQLSTDTLEFIATEKGDSPTEQSFRVSNLNNEALAWRATIEGDETDSWLTISPLTGITPASVTVKVDSTNLTTGLYTKTIQVKQNSDWAVPKSLMVSLRIENSGLNVTQAVNYSTPTPYQTIEYTYYVTNTGMTVLTDIVVIDSYLGKIGQPFALSKGQSKSIDVFRKLDENYLSQYGPSYQFTSTVSVTATSRGYITSTTSSPLTVILNVSPELSIQKIAQQQKVDKAGDVVIFNYQVQNTGNMNLYDVRLFDEHANPLIIGDLTRSSDKEYTIGYQVTEDDLRGSYFRSQVTITGKLIDYEQTPKLVTATTTVIIPVATNPIMKVTPIELLFQATPNSSPTPQTIMLDNLGTGGYTWTVDIASSGWLTTSVLSGTAPSQLVVLVNTEGLELGTYQGLLTIKSPGTIEAPQTITVTLAIVEQPKSPTLAPINNPQGQATYSVTWQEPPNILSYTLQLADSANFISPTTVYTGPLAQYLAVNRPEGTWYYRVQATNVAGLSDWSNIVSTTVRPVPPTLDMIVNHDYDGNYTVSWQGIEGASSYILEGAKSLSFDSPTVLYEGPETTTALTDQPAGIWYYRVKTSKSGVDSPWSNIRTVVVGSLELEDAYEADDTCDLATTSLTDGTAQFHNFHDAGDTDWLSFVGQADTTYVLQATSTHQDTAPTAVIYGGCDADSLTEDGFGRNVRLTFTTPENGIYYVKLQNKVDSLFGKEVSYEVSIRAKSQAPIVVIVGGQNGEEDTLKRNIIHMGNRAYDAFRRGGVPSANIRYLRFGPNHDIDQDGQPDVYAEPTLTNIEQTITAWAVERGLKSDVPFYLYLTDHGTIDAFCALDCGPDGVMTAAQLDQWLTQVEQETGADQINVIIETCFSGSFITGQRGRSRQTGYDDEPGTISGPNRVVIASTGNDVRAFPTKKGGHFSDAFFTALGANADLWAAYTIGRDAAKRGFEEQTPWLDDNGDLENNEADGGLAKTRGLFNLSSSEIPIITPLTLTHISDTDSLIQARIEDDVSVVTAYLEIYPPDLVIPETGEGETPQIELEQIPLLDADGDGIYEANYSFTKSGQYRLVAYAEDNDGNLALPQAITQGEDKITLPVYLPLIVK